jgi:hypothetical protein
MAPSAATSEQPAPAPSAECHRTGSFRFQLRCGVRQKAGNFFVAAAEGTHHHPGGMAVICPRRIWDTSTSSKLIVARRPTQTKLVTMTEAA